VRGTTTPDNKYGIDGCAYSMLQYDGWMRAAGAVLTRSD